MLGFAPARPDRPMRVALAGCPSPRPVFFGGGKPGRLCLPLRPAPPRSESGEEPRGARERVVKPACRVGAWDVLPVAGRGGAACAHARVPRGTPIPPLPRGCVCASPRSVRGAEREERGWVAVGSRAPPVHRLCPPRAVPPALPRLCRSRGPRPRRARRVRASLVLCAVWRSPRSPLPGSVPTVGEQRLTRPSSGSGIRFWLGGVVTSLSGAAFGENGGRSSPGASPDASGPVAAGGPSFGGGGRVCLGGGSVREGARGRLCAFREPREGRRLSGRPSSAAWRWVRRPRCVWGLFRPRRRRPPGRRVSCGEPSSHRVGCLAVRYPPLACFFSYGAAAGAPVDDSPRPRGAGPSERRGPRRPPSRPSRGRPFACRRRLFPPSRLSPALASTRAARCFAVSRSPPPPPLVWGRPPSVSPAKPVGAVCRLPPGRFPVSRPRPERVRVHPALLPGVAPRCRVCGGARRGPTPALERPPAAAGLEPRRGQ